MKKFVMLPIVIILVLGCISEKQETPQKPPLPPNGTSIISTPSPTTPAPTTLAPPTTASSILGKVFTPVYKDKMWSKYRYNSNGEENEVIWKMFDDKDIYVFEYEFEVEGVTSVTQMWSTKTNSPQNPNPIKYIMKIESMVYCMNTVTFSNPTENYTPDKYEKYTIIGEDTYTTPTGKTVKVFIISDGKSEIWFSEEVPFSIVKVTDEESTILLEDFGFNAKRKISRKEGENCIPMSTP